VVIGLFGYLYWSTTTFVMSRSDSAIEAERAMLRNVYDSGGRASLIQAIMERDSAARGEGAIYLLANDSFAPVVGNLKKWPPSLRTPDELSEFNSDPLNAKTTIGQALFRAKWETLPDGFHLLVGRDISDLGRFASKIHAALAFAIFFIFILAAVASVSVTRRTVGRIESINATSRAIMDRGLGRRIPLHGTGDEWDHLAENLNSMLDRIEALMSDIKQVSDNVAHDLRTPLTRMRGRLEKASMEKSCPDHEQSVIAIIGISGLNAVQFAATKAAAKAIGLEAELIEVRFPDDFEGAIETAKTRHADAGVVLSSPLVHGQMKHIAELALTKRVP
jgi:signal transduction histidine kinase